VPVGLRKIGTIGHRVNQVVRGTDAGERAIERAFVVHVANDDLRACRGPSRQAVGPPGETSNATAALLQTSEKTAADVAGRPGQQNER
jgi:hypothetical protein